MGERPPSEPTTLTARLAKLLEEFTARQKPGTRVAIAKALGMVNNWLARLQKK
jgi:hypothetical protein